MASIVGSNPVSPAKQKSLETVTVRVDQPLLYTTFALLAFGLMSVYTATANQAVQETGNSLSLLIKQVVAMGIGLVGMALMIRTNFNRWCQWAQPLAIIAIGLLVLTMFIGTTANGSERWIPLPFGFQFQPSDVAKVAAIFLLAQITGIPKISMGRWTLNIVMVILMVGLIFQQPNLSVAMILTFLTGAMLFVSGFPLIIFILCLPVGGYLLIHKIMSTEYQRRRIVGWLDPWKDQMDTGYNLVQSFYAIGSGGLFGVGLGNSIQKLYYLPFQHTDFIFAVICEELGFVGATILIGLFVTLAWRGFYIALSCPSRFGQMLAFGLTLAIILQALINICVTVGLMPVTGVTLPLISYGGTSMIITLGMIGILLNISRLKPGEL